MIISIDCIEFNFFYVKNRLPELNLKLLPSNPFDLHLQLQIKTLYYYSVCISRMITLLINFSVKKNLPGYLRLPTDL